MEIRWYLAVEQPKNESNLIKKLIKKIKTNSACSILRNGVIEKA